MLRLSRRQKFSSAVWISICLLLIIILTFPNWITIFYPQPHRDLVYNNACSYNIDPFLVFAIIRAESKFQTGAESRVGAKGLMQIMPDTAIWIAEKQGIADFKPENLHDPDTNINFGCWYLASLNKEFNGHIPQVIAAYNAGRGNVTQWMANGVWDGEIKGVNKIPYEETRNYVKTVLNNYEAYQAIYK